MHRRFVIAVITATALVLPALAARVAADDTTLTIERVFSGSSSTGESMDLLGEADTLLVIGDFGQDSVTISSLDVDGTLTPLLTAPEFDDYGQVGSRVWFLVGNSDDGYVLYGTDGTPDGTVPLRDGSEVPTRPRCIKLVGDELWFNAGGAGEEGLGAGTSVGAELWRTDGTLAGTHLVADINPDGDGQPCNFVAGGDGVLFSALDAAHGEGLWTSDGTAAGTRLLVDLEPGPDGTGPIRIVATDEAIVFEANPATQGGYGLYGYTEQGTERLLDGNVFVYSLAAVGDWILLDVEGHLWRSDGTVAGTQPFIDDAIDWTPVVHNDRLWYVNRDDGKTYSTSGEDGDVRLELDVAADMVPTSLGLYLRSFSGTGGVVRRDDGAEVAVSFEPDETEVWTLAGAGRLWIETEVAGESVCDPNCVTGSPTYVIYALTDPLHVPVRTTTSTTTSTTSTTVVPTTTSTTVAPTTTTTSTTVPRTRSTTATTISRPAPTTTSTTSVPTSTSTTIAASIGSSAVIVDEATGVVETIAPVTPDGVESAGTVVTPGGDTISVTPDGTVYGDDGETIGDLENSDLNGDIVGIALYLPATKANEDDELAFWLVGADGGVFSFGGAPFLGSLGGRPLAAPIVGIVPHGRGYWLVGADGGVFAFGGAPFHGSLGGRYLNAPITSMTPSPNGYWLVAADGGVFTFGDARFRGSLGGTTLPAPIVGLVPDADGYWLVGDDGATRRF